MVTIEPGYYLNGEYGIRLENVNLVVKATPTLRPTQTAFLAFSPLTLVPFQRRLIDAAALTQDERRWVNGYHARVREALLGRLAAEQKGDSLGLGRRRTRDWLIRSTEPL